MRGARVHHRQIAVIVGGAADEHPDVPTTQARSRDTGVLQRLPGQLQGHPLLRIHVVGFHLRQREEFGVETLEVLQISAAGVGLRDPFGQPGLGHELRPPTLGKVGDGVATLEQCRPHRVGGVHLAGEAGGQTDDRDVEEISGDVVCARPVLGFVEHLQFGLSLDDHRRERLDGGVPEGHRRGQGDAGEIFDIAGHRHGVAGRQPELDHGNRLVDGPGGLSGRVGHPVAQPLAHLGDGHVGAVFPGVGRPVRLGGRGLWLIGLGLIGLGLIGHRCHSVSSGKALATFPDRRLPSR